MMFRKENCAASEQILNQTVAEVGVQHKHIPGNTHVCNDQFWSLNCDVITIDKLLTRVFVKQVQFNPNLLGVLIVLGSYSTHT